MQQRGQRRRRPRGVMADTVDGCTQWAIARAEQTLSLLLLSSSNLLGLRAEPGHCTVSHASSMSCTLFNGVQEARWYYTQDGNDAKVWNTTAQVAIAQRAGSRLRQAQRAAHTHQHAETRHGVRAARLLPAYLHYQRLTQLHKMRTIKAPPV